MVGVMDTINRAGGVVVDPLQPDFSSRSRNPGTGRSFHQRCTENARARREGIVESRGELDAQALVGRKHRRHGDAFDFKEFHTAALNMGGMGLDPLAKRLATL